ncbi:MAG: endolytic transglycosylase MltG [Elusimicrobiota bacterium]|nr:endolytic transglycosylase MltG [Elusimicrobiota bacterium]
MRRALLAAAAAAALAVVVAALALRPGATVRVEIPEGLSARQTASLLASKRVVPSAFAFRLFLKVTGFDRALKPGAYDLRVNEPLTSLTRKLTLGLTADVKVVIPEGFMARQIAERLEAAGVAKAAEVMKLVGDRRLEGRLFPSTYQIPLNHGAERVLKMMNDEFERQIVAAYKAASPRPVLSLEDALILASIVEREAVLPAERPMIAAVYLNRLKKGMRLQADPTTQYALGHWKKVLTRSDLQNPSPFNTYAHKGLPPAPICSPGRGSFEAVLKPASTRALYFVADTTGGHVFSETNEEHSAARQRYKRELRKIKEKLKREKASEPH